MCEQNVSFCRRARAQDSVVQLRWEKLELGAYLGSLLQTRPPLFILQLHFSSWREFTDCMAVQLAQRILLLSVQLLRKCTISIRKPQLLPSSSSVPGRKEYIYKKKKRKKKREWNMPRSNVIEAQTVNRVIERPVVSARCKKKSRICTEELHLFNCECEKTLIQTAERTLCTVPTRLAYALRLLLCLRWGQNRWTSTWKPFLTH